MTWTHNNPLRDVDGRIVWHSFSCGDMRLYVASVGNDVRPDEIEIHIGEDDRPLVIRRDGTPVHAPGRWRPTRASGPSARWDAYSDDGQHWGGAVGLNGSDEPDGESVFVYAAHPFDCSMHINATTNRIRWAGHSIQLDDSPAITSAEEATPMTDHWTEEVTRWPGWRVFRNQHVEVRAGIPGHGSSVEIRAGGRGALQFSSERSHQVQLTNGDWRVDAGVVADYRQKWSHGTPSTCNVYRYTGDGRLEIYASDTGGIGLHVNGDGTVITIPTSGLTPLPGRIAEAASTPADDSLPVVGDRVRHIDGRIGTITNLWGYPSLLTGVQTWSALAARGWTVGVDWDGGGNEEADVRQITRIPATPTPAVDDTEEGILQVVDNVLKKYADERGWCADYEVVIGRINAEIGRDVFTQRNNTYTGSIGITFQFEAPRNGDARAAADVIRLAVAEYIAGAGFDISDIDTTHTANQV